jgi:hypothetical protein
MSGCLNPFDFQADEWGNALGQERGMPFFTSVLRNIEQL